MSLSDRQTSILSLVNHQGYASVRDLSQMFSVSEVTIRRDLQYLEERNQLERTHGGATKIAPLTEHHYHENTRSSSLLGGVDVLIASSVSNYADRVLVDRTLQHGIPIISESQSIDGAVALIAPDNAAAGFALGQWAVNYMAQVGSTPIYLLELDYHLPNIQERLQGFRDGLYTHAPQAQLVLNMDARSRHDIAYQVTSDALSVHPQINLIFAANGPAASGAIRACKDMSIAPNAVKVVCFGLEGNGVRDALSSHAYCCACVATFPEVVAPMTIAAAIAAFQRHLTTPQIVSPHRIITAENLSQYYQKTEEAWSFQDPADLRQTAEQIIADSLDTEVGPMPTCVGLLVPFREHGWYQQLTRLIQVAAESLSVDVEIIDAEKHLHNEIILRRQIIAKHGADHIAHGDVVLIGSGEMCQYLAELLSTSAGITVITTSLPVFDRLRHNPNIQLILVGGSYDPTTQCFVGSMVDAQLRAIQADKVFFEVAGIDRHFGLSMSSMSQTTAKLILLESGREVILMTDHTRFHHRATVQMAPLDVIDTIIVDDAVVADDRLLLSSKGIHVIVARA